MRRKMIFTVGMDEGQRLVASLLVLETIQFRSDKARCQAMTANFEIGLAFIVAMVISRLGNMLKSRLNGTGFGMGPNRRISQPLESKQHSQQSNNDKYAAHIRKLPEFHLQFIISIHNNT